MILSRPPLTLQLWRVAVVHVPSITAADLLLAPSMLLSFVEASLGAVQTHFSTSRHTQLAHLRLDMLYRLQRPLCIARANLFCCSAAEVGLVGATKRLQDLISHAKELSVSEGSKRAAARAAAKHAAEAAAAAGAGREAGEVGPQPRRKKRRATADERPPELHSLRQLWHAVSQDFDSVIHLRALMVVLGLSTTNTTTNRRLTRSELEISFSTAMGTRRDPIARALAVKIYPDLKESLVHELRQAEEQEDGRAGGGDSSIGKMALGWPIAVAACREDAVQLHAWAHPQFTPSAVTCDRLCYCSGVGVSVGRSMRSMLKRAMGAGEEKSESNFSGGNPRNGFAGASVEETWWAFLVFSFWQLSAVCKPPTQGWYTHSVCGGAGWLISAQLRQCWLADTLLGRASVWLSHRYTARLWPQWLD